MLLAGLLNIQKYLKGTTNYGLMFKKENGEKLIGWSDSYYAGFLDDRRSTSSYVFMTGSKLGMCKPVYKFNLGVDMLGSDTFVTC